jgi:hypothetical protein
MPRKPASAEVTGEGDARYVVLTYANGEVTRKRVETDSKPTRRPRRPPVRLQLAEDDTHVKSPGTPPQTRTAD